MRGHWIAVICLSVLLASNLLMPIEDAYATTTFVDALDTNADDNSGLGLAFNTSGSKMFLSGDDSQAVLEFTCTTNFDVSTCSTTGDDDLDVSADFLTPDGIAFNTAGTKLFIVDSDNGVITEWSCPAFDIDTCNNNNGNDDKDVSGDLAGDPTGVAFNTDGTKMFVSDTTGVIYEYSCPAFDIGTCDVNENADDLNIAGTAASPTDLAFSSDGTKMFVTDDTSGEVNEYTLTTGFDVSTAAFVNVLDISTPEANPGGITFSTDGLTMFVSGSSGGGGLGGGVSEFTLEVTFDLFSSPSSSTNDGGGSSASKHETAPTFGTSYDGDRQVVEDGFVLNDVPVDITNNFHTDYPKQLIKVGQDNTFTLKVQADKGIRVIALYFGVPEVGMSHAAEAEVDVIIGNDNTIEDIRVIQKEQLVNVEKLSVDLIKSKCTSSDSEKNCITISTVVNFNEAPLHDVLALQAIDNKRRHVTTYFNDGIDVVGKSLNPPVSAMIISPIKYSGLMKVTQVDKENDLWETADGTVYTKNNAGTWMKVSPDVILRTPDPVTSHGCDRLCNWFNEYVQGQIILAEHKLMEMLGMDSIQNDMPDYTPAPWTDSDKRKSPEFLALLEHEKIRIAEMMNQIYDPRELWYPIEMLDEMVEIDRDDRPVSIILAEEREMKKILADERAYLKQILAPQQ